MGAMDRAGESDHLPSRFPSGTFGSGVKFRSFQARSWSTWRT